MQLVFWLISFLLTLYLYVLLARVVIDLIQVFSRTWRPTGAILVVANMIYALTEPPLRFIRRFVRPVPLGGVQLDLAFLILFLGLQLVRGMIVPLLAALFI